MKLKAKAEELKPPVGKQSAPTEAEIAVMARDWKRPDQIDCQKDTRFKYRLVTEDKVRYWKNQGFVIDTSNAMFQQENQPMAAGVSRYRGLILMKCLKQVAEQRAQHYIKIQSDRMRSAVKGATVTTAAGKVNAGRDEEVTGAIGKVVIQEVLTNTRGQTFTSKKTHRPDDIDPREAEKLAKLRDDQAKENAERDAG